MKVLIKYFASAADAARRREESFDTDARTVGELLARLGQTYPALASLRPYLRVAVGQEYATDTDRLSDGDEVAILPPVCGG